MSETKPSAVTLTLVVVSVAVILSMTPVLPPSPVNAQPSKGLNCFACHPREDPSADKGCLACHEGNQVKSERKQAILVEYARHVYGKGDGYECALCHRGDPASRDRDGAHRGLIADPASREVRDRGLGCSMCHIDDEQGNMLTEMPRPGTTRFVAGITGDR